MALATTMKLLPLGYCEISLPRARARGGRHGGLRGISDRRPRAALLRLGNYLDIYRFANERKGNDWLDIAGALLLRRAVHAGALVCGGAPRASMRKIESDGAWCRSRCSPALLANSGRHLLIALIVPDRRAGRNLAAAVGLALHGLLPDVVRLGSLHVMTSMMLRRVPRVAAARRRELRADSDPAARCGCYSIGAAGVRSLLMVDEVRR